MNLEVIPMFNKSLLALVLAAATGSAFAAPVANLKIDGKVTPPTCTVNGAEAGEIVADFGKISPSLLVATGTDTKMFTVTVPMTVSCDAKTYLTMVPTDTYRNVDVEQTGSYIYRSALVSDSNKSASIGNSYFMMNNMTVDGKAAFLGRETSSHSGNSNVAIPGIKSAWTTETQLNVAPGSFKLAAGQVFTTDLAVYSLLYSKQKMTTNGIDLTEAVDFVGENVLTFNFGI
ncbi:DUF1120 domain-containing protein [Serratia fonticola]|uniref:DUF1120 domain-containing protein n=1 Tax=Serratia fonticola TaxID=47917 RepID=UPI0034C63435|nr:DUF1120 domain-containing protein [Serratia fonticola]